MLLAHGAVGQKSFSLTGQAQLPHSAFAAWDRHLMIFLLVAPNIRGVQAMPSAVYWLIVG